MVNHSPFAIATAVALPEATPDFSRDLYIANAARSTEGDMVTIRSSSDQNFKKYLTTRQPVDGYSIAQIEWSEDVGKTKVTISKDGEFATLTFNQSLLSQAASAGRPVVDQMLRKGADHPLGKDGPSFSCPARGVIERNPKIVSAPASSVLADSLKQPASVPAAPVPPPGIAPPKPLGPSQQLSDKQQQ